MGGNTSRSLDNVHGRLDSNSPSVSTTRTTVNDGTTLARAESEGTTAVAADSWSIMMKLGDWGLVQRKAGADLYDDKQTHDEQNNNNTGPTSNVHLNTRYDDGQTPLTLALRSNDVTAVKDLLQQPGIDLNYTEIQKYSMYSCAEVPPLIVAAKTGNPELVRLLLESGASVNVTDSCKCSALYYTAEAGDTDIFALLLKHKAVLVSPPEVYDPLHQACRHGHLDIVKELFDKGCEINPRKVTELMSPLQLAIQYQHEDICLHLLNNGADHSDKGNTLLQPFIRACWYGCPRVVQYLIHAGIDVNMTPYDNTSGIVYALRSGDLSRIGRESRVCNADELTKLEINFRLVLQESVSVLNLLCDAGCDIEGRTGISNLSPLCLSLEARNIPAAIVLLKHGASWDDTCDHLYERSNIKSLQKTSAILSQTLLGFLNNKRRSISRRRDSVNRVSSLRECCRHTVRSCLQRNRTKGKSILPSVRTLNQLPKLLQDFLCYSEIDEQLLISETPISIIC